MPFDDKLREWGSFSLEKRKFGGESSSTHEDQAVDLIT